MKAHLALDFGGTRSRAALFDDDLTMLRRTEMLSRVADGPEITLERLIALGKSLLDGETEVASIGIAAPGPLDTAAGINCQSRDAARLVAGADCERLESCLR